MNFNIKTKSDYLELVKYLKTICKQESIEDKNRHTAILNTRQNVLGIAMANIRKIARAICKQNYEEFLQVCLNASYKQEYYEETLIQGLVIAEIKDLEIQKKYLKIWIKKIDNWSTCDSVVSTMKGLKKSTDKKDYFEFYYNLCFSDKEFESRFGIIVLMTCYLEEDYIDKILQMCEKVTLDKYYVKMAIAWCLSFAFMKFKNKTYELFEKRVLDKFTQNKAISKCRDSFQVEKLDKENLINFRIK